MTSASFFAIFALIGIINGAPSSSGSGNVLYEVPIPRGQTKQDYFKSVADYWTPERMASAVPMHPILTTKEITPFVNVDENRGVERILTEGVEAPNARAENDPSAAGRIFFSMNKLNYVCSGSCTTANNRASIITAGHCVFNNTGKIWAENLVYVPNYHQTAAPHGKFVARKMATKQLWKDKGDYNHDVAIVTVNANDEGTLVQDQAGAFGIVLDAAKAGATNCYGFPMNIGSGEYMSNCIGNTRAASILFLSSFKGIQIQCGMGGGASGGPWLRNYNTATKIGHQCSLTSFGHSFAPGYVNGPSFNNDNIGTLHAETQNA
ncbi:unnamed protein product [Adineta steineri]|uniref:Peptidase S1 domain-containing protein n=1 Tax=Adineta steineri TaxID=433720 RepID=A0A819J3Q6_9BILA|nr:unnamed protein product [Adineta steineri]CAF1115776.1 unnamed protein product [Adineta steineri]CAF1513314.1 unnamed protein product [Adineta steineri]CAF3580503.1 unnamed protein product [Adineta steineri]CAF3897479.1 unnamed protein product [Adineta steineri]